MEEWVVETACRRSMVVSRTAWWRWIMKNWLPEQSRQWKGISSALMVEPHEHKKDPGVQMSEDTGVGVWCIRRDMVYSRGEGKKYRP